MPSDIPKKKIDLKKVIMIFATVTLTLSTLYIQTINDSQAEEVTKINNSVLQQSAKAVKLYKEMGLNQQELAKSKDKVQLLIDKKVIIKPMDLPYPVSKDQDQNNIYFTDDLKFSFYKSDHQFFCKKTKTGNTKTLYSSINEAFVALEPGSKPFCVNIKGSQGFYIAISTDDQNLKYTMNPFARVESAGK